MPPPSENATKASYTPSHTPRDSAGLGLTALSKGLYVTLAILTVTTVAVSLQPSIHVRQVRNLTILASFVVGVALLFADRWVRPAAIWAGIGLISGLLYFGYEVWSLSRARRAELDEEDGTASPTTILMGMVGWPLMLPEVIEYGLADLGVLGTSSGATPPDAPPDESPQDESSESAGDA